MTAAEETRRIIELLRARHSVKEGWAAFVEMREATGFAKLQSVDFFAIHTWPSKGYRSVAYEVKVTRSDFKNEIDKPFKRIFAEGLANECFFATPRGLISTDEVPEGWGLIEADNGGLRVAKHAMQRQTVEWPQHFIISMARRMSDPPSPLPAVAWRYLGREIGENELIKIAEGALNRKLEDEQAELIRKGTMNIRNSQDYKELLDLRHAVSQATNIYSCTGDAFREWLVKTQLGNLPIDTQRQLRILHETIGKILDTEKR